MPARDTDSAASASLNAASSILEVFYDKTHLNKQDQVTGVGAKIEALTKEKEQWRLKAELQEGRMIAVGKHYEEILQAQQTLLNKLMVKTGYFEQDKKDDQRCLIEQKSRIDKLEENSTEYRKNIFELQGLLDTKTQDCTKLRDDRDDWEKLATKLRRQPRQPPKPTARTTQMKMEIECCRNIMAEERLEAANVDKGRLARIQQLEEDLEKYRVTVAELSDRSRICWEPSLISHPTRSDCGIFSVPINVFIYKEDFQLVKDKSG